MVCVLSQRELRSIEQVLRRIEEHGLSRESQAIRDVIHTSSSRRLMRASEAAAILGVTPQTVRNWVKRAVIPGEVDATGHILVEVKALQNAVDLSAALPDWDGEPISEDVINAEINALRSETVNG